MKSFVVVFIMILVVTIHYHCGSGNEKNENKTDTKDITQNPDYQKGLAIVSKSDCFTCHKIDEKLTGPAYRDVANKYAGMPDTIIKHLANKILKGGGGVWGDIPMLAHTSLSEEDAEAAVKYILLLKK